MHGFLDLKMKKWTLNLMTWMIAITPSLIVSIIGGSSGAGRLIIIASMILSFELPFALIPLLKSSSSKTIIVFSWILGLAIIEINIYYLSTGFVDWLIHNSLPKVASIFVGIIVFPIMAVYILTVIYMTFRRNRVATFIESVNHDPTVQVQMEDGVGVVGSDRVHYREDLADIPLPQ
ncbi:hypothetical protein CDL15_Pgr027903 [Punica granatum]|uniref:Uncharacterized protein n=1 Tax=Punica granatum TaxID=22663 RepID=A0A218XK79_PUNGR|nr:hypothetical protein CDL15_Pgr027903 [Punica granatum]